MQTKLISIYTDFIADFEAKLDPLKLSQIGMVVVEKYSSPEEAIAFVERIQDKVKMNNEALCLCKVRKKVILTMVHDILSCQVMVGRVRLHKLQQQKETKLIIEEVEKDPLRHMTKKFVAFSSPS